MAAQRKCHSLPIDKWPAVDRDAWRRAMAPAGLFVATRRSRRWKDITWNGVETGYGFWLSWLGARGLLELTEAPGERATQMRLQDYVDAMKALELADYTVAGRLGDVGRALSVMAPELDVSWIGLGAGRLHEEAEPAKDIRKALRPAADLVDLGLQLMDLLSHTDQKGGAYASVRFRDGLLIAFLIHTPLRRRNLTALELGRHVEKRGGVWRIDIPANETKTDRPIRCAWPAVLVEPLERYLAVHREVLLGCGKSGSQTERLWISRQGKPMSPAATYQAVCERTLLAFGRPINPHLFRHIAATDLATFSPESGTAIRDILAHESMGPSEKYYNRARTNAAGQRMHETFEAIRAGFAS